MSGATVYPGAIMRTFAPGNRTLQPRIDKLVLHSTETSGLPGYRSGYTAPNLTVDPWALTCWQHFDSVLRSAKTLRDTGGFSENRDCVSQIEIIGYSDPARRESGKFLPDLGEPGIEYLAKIIAWYALEHGVPLVIPAAWPAYPKSYGSSAGARMSTATYDAFRGVLGHLHVPDNAHGDPTLRIDLVMERAKAIAFPPEPEPIPDPAVEARPTLRATTTPPDDHRKWTRHLQAGLLRVFPSYSYPIANNGGADGVYGRATLSVVAEFQRRSGLDDDGVVGPKTWAELALYGI